MPKHKIGKFRLSLPLNRKRNYSGKKYGPKIAPWTIPKFMLKILKTENEQRVYTILAKLINFCKNLNCRIGDWTSAYYAHYHFLDFSKKETVWFGCSPFIKSFKHISPEERIEKLTDKIDEILGDLHISDVNANDITEDYDAFNEKFEKALQEWRQ